MGVFVLVRGHHGWRPVRDLLEAAGHATHVPALTGYGDRAHLARRELRLRDHVAEVIDLLLAEALTDVALAGHSYGAGG